MRNQPQYGVIFQGPVIQTRQTISETSRDDTRTRYRYANKPPPNPITACLLDRLFHSAHYNAK